MSGTPPTRFPELHAFFARTEPRPTIGARSTPTTPPMCTSMPSSRRQRRTAARSDPAHPAMAALFSPGPSRTWAGSRTHRGMGHAERERRAIFLGTSRTGAATRPPISPAPRCPSRCLSRSRTSSAAASPPQEPGPHPRHHCLSPSRRRSYPPSCAQDDPAAEVDGQAADSHPEILFWARVSPRRLPHRHPHLVGGRHLPVEPRRSLGHLLPFLV
jgi:hypothetical protein